MADNFTPCGCAICANAVVLPDPDPNDWFCDDDVKVVCDAVPVDVNGAPATSSVITRACRPYMTAKECSYIPDWCPQGGKPTPRSL